MLCNLWHYPTQSHTTSACFQKFILLSKITAMIKGHFRSTVLWAYLPPCTLFESQLSIKPFFFSPTLICLIWKKKKALFRFFVCLGWVTEPRWGQIFTAHSSSDRSLQRCRRSCDDRAERVRSGFKPPESWNTAENEAFNSNSHQYNLIIIIITYSIWV